MRKSTLLAITLILLIPALFFISILFIFPVTQDNIRGIFIISWLFSLVVVPILLLGISKLRHNKKVFGLAALYPTVSIILVVLLFGIIPMILRTTSGNVSITSTGYFITEMITFFTGMGLAIPFGLKYFLEKEN